MMKLFARKLTAVAAIAMLSSTVGCLADEVDDVDHAAETIRVDDADLDSVEDSLLDGDVALEAHAVDLAAASFAAEDDDDGEGGTLNQLMYNPDPTPWLDANASTEQGDEGGGENPDPTPWKLTSSNDDEEPDPQPWNVMNAD